MKSNAQMGYGALALAGLCLLLGSVANAASTGKIEICHKAGERNQRILFINEEKDGDKHFGHGDYLVQPEVCDGLDSDCEKPPVADNGVDCDDGIACTDDECGGVPGCFNVPNDAHCNDSNDATTDSCDPTDQSSDSNGCVYTVIPPICGNGQVEEGEQCDDGNLANGDGCSDSCQIEVIAACPCEATWNNGSVAPRLDDQDDRTLSCSYPNDFIEANTVYDPSNPAVYGWFMRNDEGNFGLCGDYSQLQNAFVADYTEDFTQHPVFTTTDFANCKLLVEPKCNVE